MKFALLAVLFCSPLFSQTIVISGGAAGPAGGDLIGNYPNPTVVNINGLAVPANQPCLGSNSLSQLISGNCAGGTGGGMVYPAAGIPSSTGTAWDTSYSPTNLIPANFISVLPYDPTGSAASAQSAAIAASDPAGSAATVQTNLTATNVIVSGHTTTLAGLGTASTHPATDFATPASVATAQAAAIASAVSTGLQKASNLSDLANLVTARTNLGLGSASLLTAPTGTLVGTTDTQTLTNKTLDGVAPATMVFLDATSSIQTQLGTKLTSASWATPGAIGSTTPNSGAFSTLTVATSIGVGSSVPTACGSASGCFAMNDSSVAGTPTAGQSYLYVPTATNVPTMSINGGSEVALRRSIASGSSATSTAAIAVGACFTNTFTATNVVGTDSITWNPNGSIKAITGFVPSTNGGLTISAFPSTGNVNFEECNWTTASITPGAITINWSVAR